MRIGELAGRMGINAKTIRYYEEVGVLPRPVRSRSGYRHYGTDAIERLRFVQRAQAAGLSLKQIRQIMAIRDGGAAPCGHVRDMLATRLDEVRAHIAELIALEGHLESLLAHGRGAPTGHDLAAVCWILEADTGYRGEGSADLAVHSTQVSVQS